MNEAAAAFEYAVNSSHRGTKVALWVVMACVCTLVMLVLR